VGGQEALSMAAPSTPDVAAMLREYGQRLSLKGGNPYRAQAYVRAADGLAALSESLGSLIAEDRLTELPGIGDAIAAIIETMHRTGSYPKLEEMRKEMPAGVLEMLAVTSLRPDKVLKIYRDLGVRSLAQLEEAARSDRIAQAKGLGTLLQTKILQNIEIAKSGERRLHMGRANALLRHAAQRLERLEGINRVVIAGDLRRGCELVGELALVAEGCLLTDAPSITTSKSELKVYLSDRHHFGGMLLEATGSAERLEALREHAKAKSYHLDINGVWKGRKLIASASEEAIYSALGLQFIPPELREGSDEIKLAKTGKLPLLVEDADIRGILHAHTDSSDGVNTLEEMVEATRSRGYEYFGVADHSKSAHYAGGLSIAQLTAQHKAIDRLNKKLGDSFRVFKGIESDILAGGSLDYPDDVLARFDFVVASVHSRFRLDSKEQTRRIVNAVANPYTTILGHMTGRQLLRRPGYELHIETVLKACGRHGVAVEVNSNPWRLDLDWRWHRRALELGCMLSINPDAHSIDEIDLTHWGVEMARKGSVPAVRVLNWLPLADFQRHLERRKKRMSRAA
jgi:DNA polymerase (family X)